VPGEVGRKMLKVNADALLQKKCIFENLLDQIFHARDSEVFHREADISGFERHINWVTKRNPLFEMSAAHLSFCEDLLPSDHTLIIKSFVKLKREMKINGFADLQRHHSSPERNYHAHSTGTHIAQKIGETRLSAFSRTQKWSRAQIDRDTRLRSTPVLRF